jgi:hypothetical protein
LTSVNELNYPKSANNNTNLNSNGNNDILSPYNNEELDANEDLEAND